MQIDRNFYNQYRDTPFKIEDTTNPQKNMFFLGQKIKNPNMDEYAQYVIENTKEVEPQKKKRTSYNIILRASYDKTKRGENKSQEKGNSLLNNNSQDDSNLDTAKACSKNDVSFKLNFPKNNNDNDALKQKGEKEENKDNSNMIVDEENDNHSKDINNQNNKIYINDNENEEENKNNKYYNPFNAENIGKNENIGQKNVQMSDEENINVTLNNKLPNITLTTFPFQIKKDKEKIGKFSRFLNLFSSKKKDKKKIPESQVDENKEDKEKEKNELKTLEQRLVEENIITNEDKNVKDKEIGSNNNENKYDIVLGVIGNKEDKNKNKENEKNKGMKGLIGDDKEKGFSERQNVYEAENKLKSIQDNNNSQTYIINAEPIMNNDNKEETIEAQSDLDNSSRTSDYDKSSMFSFLSSSKFSQLIKPNSKCSALLLAILFGSCGLFYLAYKKLKLKDVIEKIGEYIKVVPEFSNNILSIIGAGFDDFMERYDDIHRFLVGLIIVILLWIIIRLLLKKIMKRKK